MARIARRANRIKDLPLFSLGKPWAAVTDGGGELPLNLFEPRYVELARRIEPPAGKGRFGYSEGSPPRRGSSGVIAEADAFRWMGPKSSGPLALVARGRQRFRILTVREEAVAAPTDEGQPPSPLFVAHVELLSDRDLARRMPTTALGQTYAQGGVVGLASYHLKADGSAFVSYESPLCEHLPDLDDGTRPPALKVFEDTRYDAETRSFHGTVSWAPTSWAGAERWQYEMVFARDFASIERGQVRMFKPGASEASKVLRYGRHIHYRRWTGAVDQKSAATASLLNAGAWTAARREKRRARRRKSKDLPSEEGAESEESAELERMRSGFLGHFEKPGAYAFRAGDIVVHRLHGQVGVVSERFGTCRLDDAWFQANSPPGMRSQQPFYTILVSSREGFTRHGAQSSHRRWNVSTDGLPPENVHPAVSKLFGEIRIEGSSARYRVLNAAADAEEVSGKQWDDDVE